MSTSRAIKPKRDETHLPKWEATPERAPSIERDDRPTLARFLAMVGLFFEVLGGLSIGFRRDPNAFIGPGWGFFFLTIGLGLNLLHVFVERDMQFRRLYGFAGVALALSGVILKFVSLQRDYEGWFILGGAPALMIGLIVIIAVARNETDAYFRSLLVNFVGGLGSLLIAFAISMGLRGDFSYLPGEGAVILMLGLFYVTAFIGSQDATSERGYYAGLSLAGVAVVGIVLAVVCSFMYSNFLIPSGLILIGMSVIFLGIAAGTCLDWPIIVLARRELGSYFYSPVAYLVFVGQILFGWLMFMLFVIRVEQLAPQGGMPEPIVGEYVVSIFPVIVQMFFVPALTMRLFSEEKRTGTLEVLLTAPVNEIAIVTGKFLACWIFYLLLWIPWWLFFVSLRYLGGEEFDYRPILSFMVAMMAISAGFLAMGIFFSALTSNQIVAAVLAFAGMMGHLALYFLQFVPFVRQGTPLADFLNHVNFVDFWINSLDGQMSPRYVVLHASIAVFFLFATVKVLESRKRHYEGPNVMASADTLGAKTRLDDLASTARFVFIGLVWGTAMLGTVGAWLRTKYEPAQMMWANVFLIAAAAAGLLALWQAFTIWIKKEPADQRSATLTREQSILSMIFMAAGLGLIVMGFIVGLVKKPGWPGFGFVLDNLPESLGVLIFGLITLGSGYALSTSREQAGGASLIRWLTHATQLLKLILFIVSLTALGSWGYLVYKKGEFFSSVPVPEHTALLVISILSFGCLLWLNTGAFDEVGTRLLVLVFGGGVGLIFFLTTLFRAYLWRQDIFLGGSDAWQGPNAWHFWICAYALFFSLVVIFASLNVARADIRSSVVLRRVLYGYDALAQAFLLFGILFVLNVVVYARFPLTFDWTKTRGAYALSDSSKFLLSKLKEEANVYVILPQNHPAYKDLRVLLDNCQALSDQKFKVNYLAGDFDQKLYRDLAKRFPVILPDPLRQSGGRGVLVVYGALPADPKQPAPHAFIADTKILTEEDGPRGVRPKRMFKGEAEILKELKFLAQGKQKRKIYFLQGFDDMSISNMGGGRRRDMGDSFAQVGINLLAKRLEIENHEVFGLSFRVEIPGQKTPPNLRFAKEEGAEKKKEIPDDCHTLVVAGVSRPLPPEVLGALERYMERDSKNTMLVFLDVVTEPDYSKLKESGLEPFLKRFGVEVTNEFTLGMPQHARDDPAELIAKAVHGTDNPLARQFAGFPIGIKNSARVVRPVEATRYKAETILVLDKADLDWFVKADAGVLRNPMNHFLDLAKNNPQKLRAAIAPDSISIAVAVTESKGDKPRMLVFGDAEFISNVELSQGRIYNDFTISALEWTAEREGMIGPQPKVTSYYSIGAAANIPRMILLPGWLMLLTLIGLGVGIWVVRRR